jgi:hypothetical protein
MPGITCNDGYVCEDDIITYEPIDDPNNCVALENGVCTTCDSINVARQSNPLGFNEDPIKISFAIDRSKEENDAFWDLLSTKCKINRPSTAAISGPEFYVAEPDYDLLNSDFQQIQQRIQQYTEEQKITNSNASKFINAIYKVATSARGIDFTSKSDAEEFFKNEVRKLLIEEQCSSQMIHKVNELPLSIQTFLNQLVESPENKFIQVAKLLDTKPGICLEGVLTQCFNILERQNAGRKRKTRKIRKNKKTQKRKTKKNKSKKHKK